MSLSFDKPCKFDFSIEFHPDGNIHTSYSCTLRSALLFPATFDRVSNFAFYMSNQISQDLANLGVSPKNKEASICK